MPLIGTARPRRGVSRRRFLPELGEKKECRRLGGLGSELGGALGSQGCGECSGRLNLAREGWGAVNLREGAVGVLWSWTENARRRPRWCSRGGGSEPGASTSCGDAVGKQLRGGEGRARRCSQQLCPGGRASPPAQHCSKPYPLEPSFVVLQISPKV